MLKELPNFLPSNQKYTYLLRNKSEREELIRKVTDIIRSTLDINIIKSSFTREVGKLFEADRCCINFISKEGNNFLPIDEYSEYLSSKYIKRIVNRIIDIDTSDYVISLHSQNKPVIISDIDTFLEDNPDLRGILGYHGYKSRYGFPIFIDDQLIGAFILHYIHKKVILCEEDINLLEIISGQLGIAIKQARLYAEAQESAKFKSELLANISQEFRVPLNSIIGFTDMVLSGTYGQLPDKVTQYLNNVSVSGKHLLDTTNDLLDISMIESGKLNLNYEKFNSTEIIREVILLSKQEAQIKEITIDSKLSDIELNADKIRFKQIISNLVCNTIKYNQKGGKVFIKSEIDHDKLIVMIEGTSFYETKQKKAFAQLAQIDSSYIGNQEKFELSLFLTRKLIELHNGFMHFNSEEEKGSRFWFMLPEANIQY